MADTGKLIAGGVVLAAGGYLAYKLWPRPEDNTPYGLKIVSIENQDTGVVAEPPSKIVFYQGQYLIVDAEFTYKGVEQSNVGFRVALMRKGTNNEVAGENIYFNIPACEEKTVIPVQGSVQMDIKQWWDYFYHTWWKSEVFDIYIKIFDVIGANYDYRLSGVVDFKEGTGEVDEWVLQADVIGMETTIGTGVAEWKLQKYISSMTATAGVGAVEWVLQKAVTGMKTIAEAEEEEYVINVASDPVTGGWVTIDPEKDHYAYGEGFTLTAHRVWPYEFSYWDMDGKYYIMVNPYTYAAYGNHKFTAHFKI